ncbi:MAG: ABC transporter substrate-binding protein [Alphaproteobacteria bacterium]|nr:ABC transporter substrate-binding protein [Alphaproteobacteria bacterium]
MTSSTKLRRGLIGLVSGAFVLACSVAGTAAEHPAALSLSNLVADVTALTAVPEERRADRTEAVRRILHEYFNLPLIGRAVLGRHWRSITDAQKDAYQHAFEEHTVQLVDGQLERISGGSLAVLRTVSRNDRETFVYTRFQRDGEGPLEVRWRFRNRKEDGAPRIVDVAVEGVSLFATKRQEFAAIVEAAGIDGLVEALQAMNEASL